MALINVLLSGAIRVSAAGATGMESAVKGFNALTPLTAGTGSLSVYQVHNIVLGTTTSEFLVSVATLSAPKVIFATATGTTRINFSGQASSVSAASASVMTFKDLFCMMDVSGNLPSALHLGNSGSDSSTITLIIAG